MRNQLTEVFLLFFKLGCIAFGGPAAHIAMMQDEVVTKRKWMSEQHFLDMMGATNLVPGPNSTQMTMHCGHVRAGFPGLVVAGLSFITPAVFFTLVLAIVYSNYGAVPAVAPFFYGIKPAVIGIIGNAALKLGNKAFKTKWMLAMGVFVALLSLLGINEFLLIIGCAMSGILAYGFLNTKGKLGLLVPFSFFIKPAEVVVEHTDIFLSFLKIAMVLFGSGYVLIAYIDAELVENLGWLSKQELLDAIAMGQFTPGPVLTTATFVGYQLQGVSGALWASLGMFLPSFFLVGVLVKLIPVLRKSKVLSFVLDAVNIGAVGIMIAVFFKLGYDFIFDWKSALTMGLSILVAFGFKKVSPVYIILGGGVMGYLLSFF